MSALPRLLSVLAVLTAACPPNALAQSEQTPPAFVLVIDGTNSMTSKIKGVTKLDMVRGAFAKSMSSAPRKANAALLSFGDQPARACEDVTTLLPLAPAEKSANAIRAAFGKIDPTTSGKTPILAAAAQAAQIIESQGRNATGGVIVVTDGGDDCSPAACEKAEAFHSQHPNVAVHVVSLRPDRLIGAQLRCIASGTGGQFSEAQNEQQIAQAVSEALRYAPTPMIAAAPPAPPAATPAPAADPIPRANAAPVTAPAPTPAAVPSPSAVSSTQPDAPLPQQASAFQPDASSAPVQAPTTNALQPGKNGPPPNVTLRASLAPGSAPLTQGVGWRVFAAKPAARDREGSRSRERPLWTGAGAEARMKLAPGSYYAEAAFGLVKTGSQITVPASGEIDAVVPLNAGVINVRAVGRPGGAPLDRVFYRLYEDSAEPSSGVPAEVGRSSLSQAVFYVPAGRYRVFAEFGSATAWLPATVTPGAALALDVPMNAGSLKLETKIEPGAASAAQGAPTPAQPQFFYQVFAADGFNTGARREIARSSTAQPSFDLPQGAYRISVRYDLASVEKDVTVQAGEETRAIIDLSAGGVSLSSKVAGRPTGSDARSVSHIIYRLPAAPGDEMTEVARTPNTPRAVWLNSGAYRIVSQYGPYNVRESADITIKPGDAQKLEFDLRLAEARLTVDGRRGKRKIEWTVTDSSGREILRTDDPEPRLALKPGAYKAEASAGNKSWSATFELEDNDRKTVAASAQ